jgi:hypothetical protein
MAAVLHDPDRTDCTCFFMAHGASDRTLVHWTASKRDQDLPLAASQSATVPAGFRLGARTRRRPRAR